MTTPDENGWMPIASAPKDAEILVIHAGKSSVRGCDNLMAVDFWHVREKHGYDGFGHFNSRHYPATHWQPLPKLPVTP